MNSESAQTIGNPAQGNLDDDHCFEVVQDVFVKLGSTGMYSDLFITADRLIFVRLAFVVEPQGGLAGTGADPVKGWARMAGLVDKGKEYREAMQNARTNATQERKRFYGLSLKSRLGPDGRGALVIPKSNAHTFKLGQVSDNVGVIEIVLANGNSFLTEVGTASQLYDRLVLWLTGQPIDVKCDRQGLDLSLPHPAEMLKWIEDPSNSPNVKQQDCLRAANVNTYCKELAANIKKRPWLVRGQLCQLTKDRCPQLASSIGAAMAAAPGGGKSEGVAFLFGIFAALGIVAGGVTRLDSRVGSSDYSIGGWIFVVGCGLAFAGLLPFRLALRDRRRNKELAIKVLGYDDSQKETRKT